MSRRSKKNQPPENCDLLRPEKTSSEANDGRADRRDAACGDATSTAPASGARTICLAAAVCGFLLLAVVLVFGQTLRHDFVNYDDDFYVYQNPQVAHGLTAEGIAWAFTCRHASNWHPLTWLSHMLDCQVYGLAPRGHHLTNVLLHAATVILLFLVLRRLTGNFWPSAFVAAVFAIHPLRAESVAWVAERKDVLSGLFFMLTLWTYAGYVRHPFSLARYLAVLAFFALGLMAKPMLVTLPFVLLLLDYWPLGRMSQDVLEDRNKSWGGSYTATPEATVQLSPQRSLSSPQRSLSSPQRSFSILLRLAVEKVPLLVLAAASCAATLWAQSKAFSVDESMYLRIGNAAVSYVAYISQLFYPAGLAVLYPLPKIALPAWKVVGAILILTAACVGVIVWRRRYPYLFVGWFWYVGMLLPVTGLVQVGPQAMADRYTYLTQIGLCIAFAWGVADACRSWPYRGRVCGVASAIVLVLLMACTWRQASFWRDSQTLWTHTLECTSQNFVAHNNLGNALLDAGRLPEAVEQYKQALALQPDTPETQNNLGLALLRTGRPQEAVDHCEQAVILNPSSFKAHNNLGNALVHAGRIQEAIEHYQKALAIKPDYIWAHNNLGLTLYETGRSREGIEHCKQALQLARSQGQTALAKEIEEWLNDHRAGN